MYAVMGSTGKVGAAVARHLMTQGDDVLLAVRDRGKAAALAAAGARLADADYDSAAALTAVFRSASAGAFVMLPPLFDPSPGFPEARARIAVLRQALEAAAPARVVALSSIGADASRPNLLGQLTLLEHALGTLPCPVAFVRAAWFMDNAAFDLDAARRHGAIDSYLQPLDQSFPMVAAADVGTAAGVLLREHWQGRRIVQVDGPTSVSPAQIAGAFAAALARPVRARGVPRTAWGERFSAQGMRNPEPRMQMLDGFNEGWIRFDPRVETRHGATPLVQVIAQRVA